MLEVRNRRLDTLIAVFDTMEEVVEYLTRTNVWHAVMIKDRETGKIMFEEFQLLDENGYEII